MEYPELEHRCRVGTGDRDSAALRAACVAATLTVLLGLGRAQDTVWTRRLDCGRPGWNELTACGTADRFGDLVQLGTLSTPTEPESIAVLVVKYDSSGETLWSRVFDSDAEEDWPSAITVDSEGSAVIVGDYLYAESSYCGGQAIKFDRLGNLLWSRRYLFDGGTRLDGVAVDDSQNVFAVGPNWSGARHEALVMKCTPSGDLSWARTYDLGGIVDLLAGLALDRQGSLVTGGTIHDGTRRPLLMKFAPNGDTVWTRRLDLWIDNLGQLTGVCVDGTNSVVMSGWGRVVSGEPMRALTVKFSPDGELLWTRTYDSPRHSFGFGVAVDSSGGILTVGSVDDPPLGMTSSCLLLKYTPQGDTAWTRTYRLDALDQGDAASFVGSNNLYVFGATGDSVYENPDLVLMKLRCGSAIEELERASPPGRPADAAGPTLVRRGEALRLAVTAAGDYRVSLCDAAGRCVRLLHSGRLEPGEHALPLAGVPAGVYFCRLESGPTRLSRKVVLTTGD